MPGDNVGEPEPDERRSARCVDGQGRVTGGAPLGRVLPRHRLGVPGLSERRSWRNSLPVLARDLRDVGLSQVEVLLEHRLPLSSKRADVVLAGVHPLALAGPGRDC